MNEDNNNNLDLLDLDDDTTTEEALPEVTPFSTPRPKKPWLLMAVSVVVIILATYIIVRTVGGNSSSSIEVDLDAPAVIIEEGDAIVPPARPAPTPAQVKPDTPAPAPVAAPAPAPKPAPAPVAEPEQGGTPVRVIEDRKPVTFNPDKPVAKPAAKPAVKKAAAKPAPKKAVKQHVAPAHGGWYVQFGSHSTRALAESAQRKLLAQHSGLFAGKQFVILAAQLPNGTTTYRLRIAFATASDANGFCQNAKSDGLSCYVAK